MCYSLYIPLLVELLVNLYFYEFFSERFLQTRDVFQEYEKHAVFQEYLYYPQKQRV